MPLRRAVRSPRCSVRGVVKIDDRLTVHVIPRVEVRYVEVLALSGHEPTGWMLSYQLSGAASTRDIEWRGDCRPPTLRDDGKISICDYNKIAAQAVQTILTRGHRDVHLERRSDGVFLVRSGLVENDEHVVLCRRFITDMAMTARQTAIGPLDETRSHMLWEIQTAAQDLVLPDWFPLKEEPS